MRKRRFIVVALLAVVVMMAASLWEGYRQKHSMALAPAFTVGESSSAQHVLIATQSSAFKNALVHAVVAHLAMRPVFIRVVDVSALPEVRENEWTAIIVMHTWEFGKPNASAREFIERVRDRRKLIVITTSGSGRDKVPGVDAISAASVVRDVPTRLAEFAPRLDGLLRDTDLPDAAR